MNNKKEDRRYLNQSSGIHKQVNVSWTAWKLSAYMDKPRDVLPKSRNHNEILPGGICSQGPINASLSGRVCSPPLFCPELKSKTLSPALNLLMSAAGDHHLTPSSSTTLTNLHLFFCVWLMEGTTVSPLQWTQSWLFLFLRSAP